MTEGQEHWDSLFSSIVLRGIDPSRIKVNYEVPDTNGESLTVALPDTKMGLALETDEVEETESDGWYVIRLNSEDIMTLHRILDPIVTLTAEDKRRRLSLTTKQTSSHEDRLLRAMLARNLPAPDRNFRINRESGKELTTPDFTWVDLKIAYFVDGLWWHQSIDDKRFLDEVSDPENRPTIMNREKTRAEKDAVIRSQMNADGWTVLVCSDRQLESEQGVREQVLLIEQVIRRRTEEIKVARAIREREGHQTEATVAQQPEPTQPVADNSQSQSVEPDLFRSMETDQDINSDGEFNLSDFI